MALKNILPGWLIPVLYMCLLRPSHSQQVPVALMLGVCTADADEHQMGVCSIQSHPFKEHIFASGSYDEELLIWDRRLMRQPLCGATLGGGVWRIKWDCFNGTMILTATMYNGAHIIDCSDFGVNFLPVIAHYNDHNLAYGSDWCMLNPLGIRIGCSYMSGDKIQEARDFNASNSYLVSTCSFYDHSLHLWKWQLPVK